MSHDIRELGVNPKPTLVFCDLQERVLEPLLDISLVSKTRSLFLI